MNFRALGTLLLTTGCFSLFAVNLLKNGGFENGTTNWSLGQRLVKGVIAPDRDKKTEGEQSLLLEITEKNKDKDSRQTLMLSSERVPVVPETELAYSFQFACDNVVQGEKNWSLARVTINFYTASGVRLRWSDVLSIKGTFDWRCYSGKLQVPIEAAFADIRFALSDAIGKIWVDDVRLSSEGETPSSDSDLLAGLSQKVLVLPTPKKMISIGNGFVAAETELLKGGRENVKITAKLKQYYPGTSLAELGDQGYFLAVDADGIFIGANSSAGFRYANQTLKMLKDEKGYARYAIADYPSIPRRGVVCGLQWSRADNYAELLRRAEKFKLNYIWHTGSFMNGKLNRNWRTPFIESELAELKTRQEKAAMHGLELYLTATPRGIPPVEYSSPQEIAIMVEKLTQIYQKCGIKNIGVAFDDLGNIDQGKLLHESDKAKFPNGIGEAHCYFVTQIYEGVKKNCPDVNFLVLPMFYQSYASASPDEIKYTRQFAKIPNEIKEWSNCLYTAEDIRENKLLTDRLPLIWDNGYTQGKMPLFPAAINRPKNTPDTVTGYMFLLAWPQMEDALQITWLITADYMWNSANYVPEETRKRAVAFAIRDENVRNIVTSYARLSKKVLDFDFDRDTKANRLADFQDTIAKLKECQKKAESLPVRLKGILNTEISSYLKELEFQVGNLRKVSYPIEISTEEPLVPQVGEFHPFRIDKAQNTAVSLRHDAQNLYLHFKCTEPSVEKMLAKYTKHDSPVLLDDSVEIFVLPQTGQEDDQLYYHFVINSQGVFSDTKHIKRRFNHINDKYEDYKANLRITPEKGDGFWGLKVTIPLKEIGLTGKTGERFFMNLTRNRYAGDKKEYSSLAYIPADKSFHLLTAFPLFELK
ncbi:MAG: beta-N-acetylglucosaminidase domain-containing protein [Victivallales bacterium]|jgi:hypothetical protein|nr:beta-N-acetylglucosaminidase domain-containing protein [Victivallales bacterium]